MDKDSMLYWFPIFENAKLGIPYPETYMVKVNPKSMYKILDGKGAVLKPYKEEILRIARILGFPLFMRTDQLSGKHDWNKTCFVENLSELFRQIPRLADVSFSCDIMGLPINALVFRKYIPMDSKYTAFYGEMPVSPERRYFIRGGKVLCRHIYWVQDAIVNPSVKNWRQLSKTMNRESKLEVAQLTRYAEKLAQFFPDFWSVDFCRGRDGAWYFIDMATGDRSWHPQCKHRPKEMRKIEGEQKAEVEMLQEAEG